MAARLFGQKRPAGPARNRALALLVASLIVLLAVAVHAPPVRADSTLVQQRNGGCATESCSPSPISFPSSVAAGDVVVVAIAVYSGAVGSVADTFGSTFTLVAEASASPIDLFFYYATLSSSGSDAIFVTFAGATQGGVYIYEVSGVTTVGAVFEAGGGFCYPLPYSPSPPCPASTESASFQSGAFLVSLVAGTDYTLQSVVNTTAGTGFTLSPGSGGGMHGGDAEYAASGVSSPTDFPFTLTSPAYEGAGWVEMGLALAPSGSTSSTTSTTTSTTSTSVTSSSSTTTSSSSTTTSTSTTGFSSSTTFFIPVCPSTLGGTYMPVGSSFTDQSGNVWVAPGGLADGDPFSSYFFSGPATNIPPPMQSGWGGVYGTYNGQQGWIVTFYCP